MAQDFASFSSLSVPNKHASNFDTIVNKTVEFGGDVVKGLVYGPALVTGHIAETFWNSAMQVGNWVTPGDAFDTFKFDLEDTVNKYNKSVGKYYGDNKEVIDFTGDIASLFIPGAAATKILQAAKVAPESMKYFRMLGAVDRKRDEFLDRAVKAAGQRNIVAGLTTAKLQAYAAVGASAVSESIAMTALSYVSMNESQLFDDYSIGKFKDDVLFGGVFIGAFRGIATNKKIRDAIKSADNEYFKNNFVPGAEAGTPAWEKIYGLLEDAEKVADPQVRDQAINKVREYVLTDLIPKKDAAIIHNLDPYIKNLNSESFLDQFGYVKQITKYNQKLAFDLDDLDSVGDFLEKRKIVSTLGSHKQEVQFYGIAPANMNAKKSYFATKEIFLDEASAKAELARLGDGYKMFTHKTKANTIYLPAAHIQGAKPFYAINPSQVAKSKIALDTAQDYAKKVNAGVVDSPLAYYHLDTYTGNAVDNIIPTAGDLGIEFSPNGWIRFGQKESQNLDEFFRTPQNFTPEGSLSEPTIFNAKPHYADAYLIQHYQRLGKNMENASKYFPTTKKQKEAFGNNAPTFAFNSNDFIHLQTAFASGMDNIPIIHNGKIQIWNKQQVGESLKELKIELFNRGIKEHGLSVEELSVRLNVDGRAFAAGDFSKFAVYDNVKKWETYASPRHVTVQLDVGELPTRQQLLAAFDREANAAARHETNLSIIAKSYRELLPVQIMPEGLSAKQATRAPEVSGLFTYGGYAPGLSLTAQAERVGAIVHESSQKIIETINKTLTPAIAPLLKEGSELALAELNFVQNIYRRNPANLSLQLIEGGGGKGKILNLETNQFIKEANSNNDLIVSENVSQYILTQRQTNKRLVEMHNANVEIYGRGKPLNPDVDYFAPQDVRKKPYFAIVYMVDGRKAGISAGSADALTEKINLVKTKFQGIDKILTKEDIRQNKKLLDEFDSADFFANADFDTALRREGVMADLVPDTGTEIFENQLTHYGKASRRLLRNGVIALYQKDIEALKFAASKYSSAEKSIFGSEIALQEKLGNPFDDTIKTALNISSIHEFELLNRLNHTVDYAMTNAKDVLTKLTSSLREGKNEKIQEGLNELAAKHGINFNYEKPLEAIGMFDSVPRNVANDFVTKSNGLLATFSLTWDALYPIVNLLTGPMLYAPAMKNLMRNLRAGALESGESLGSVTIPGSNMQLPTVMKMLHNTTKRLFDEDYQTVLKQYADDGLIGVDTLEYTRNMRDTLDVLANHKSNSFIRNFKNNFNKATEFAAKWTVVGPNNLLKLYTADAVYQVGKAAGLKPSEIKTLAQSMISRVNGNYIPSQRPVIFQGPVGHAIGLFQTFTFAVMQNLFKYVEEGDKAALAAFVGLQTLTFGAQSNPVFKAINGHIGARDSKHKDLYTQAYNLGPLGDFVLYGAPSDFFDISLYTRGDLTPRNPTIIPTNFESIPIVSAGMKVWRGMANLVNNVGTQGKINAPIVAEALAVSSLNRPLAGLMTTFLDRSFTGSGDTITNNVDALTAWTRVLGGRPFDEAKTLDFYYRRLAYKAQDNLKMQKLGQSIKSKIASGEAVTDEDMNNFVSKYVSNGGNAKNFRKYWIQQLGKANSDLSARLYKDLADEPKFEELRNMLSETEVPE